MLSGTLETGLDNENGKTRSLTRRDDLREGDET